MNDKLEAEYVDLSVHTGELTGWLRVYPKYIGWHDGHDKGTRHWKCLSMTQFVELARQHGKPEEAIKRETSP